MDIDTTTRTTDPTADAATAPTDAPAADVCTPPRRARARARWRRAVAVAAVLALGAVAVGACGSDATADDAADAPPTLPTPTVDRPEVVQVDLHDYRFEGLPEEVPAGTRLTLHNHSSVELHELVALRLPDGEDRSVEELLALPMPELMALSGGAPAMVLLSPPGGHETIPAVGDGTLAEPGRYLVLCGIPTGADPQAYLEAAAQSQGGPPSVPGGPPHLVQGMTGEITVVPA